MTTQQYAEKVFAIIPTRGNRNATLKPLVSTLLGAGTRVILVNNTFDTELKAQFNQSEVTILYEANCNPPNLSRLWNTGLEEVERIAHLLAYERWAVAILNDDVSISSRWLSHTMGHLYEQNTAACGYVFNQRAHTDRFHWWYAPSPVSLYYRLPGWAFMLRGEDGLRADEQFRWWYGDDDLDWQARQLRGTLIVETADKTIVPQHHHPNQQTTGALARQTVIDRERFIKKWGQAPW
jgi:hypothetical protein